MKKKIILLFTALLMTISANAQFEEGKLYAGASLTGLNLSYNGANELNLGVQAKLGYMVADELMLLGNAGIQTSSSHVTPNSFSLGVGGRYYIEQNGIYLGVNAKFIHSKGYNDFMPGVFLSHTVTLEPAIYYDQSIKDHSQYSTIGLKVGIGVYL